MLDELILIYWGLSNDYDSQQIITFEMLILAWRCYCGHKRSCQAKSTVCSDAMHHVCHGDYLGLDRLAWAVYDGVLAVSPVPTLIGSHTWDSIVQDISLHLIYRGKMASEHCGSQKAGSTYAHERGTVAWQTLHSHHQGSDL